MKSESDSSSKRARSAVIYGAGGHARELCFQMTSQGVQVDAFVDDIEADRLVRNTPVLRFEDASRRFPHAEWHIAIGSIDVRARLLLRLAKANLTVGGFLAKNVVVAPSAQIAKTAQVFSGCTLSDGCEVGEHVIINFNCSISHDVTIGDETIISPAVKIAGNVCIGERVFVGIGAVIINGKKDEPIKIGKNAIIGAGACVVRDVEPHSTVVGNPGRAIARTE